MSRDYAFEDAISIAITLYTNLQPRLLADSLTAANSTRMKTRTLADGHS